MTIVNDVQWGKEAWHGESEAQINADDDRKSCFGREWEGRDMSGRETVAVVGMTGAICSAWPSSCFHHPYSLVTANQPKWYAIFH